MKDKGGEVFCLWKIEGLMRAVSFAYLLQTMEEDSPPTRVELAISGSLEGPRPRLDPGRWDGWNEMNSLSARMLGLSVTAMTIAGSPCFDTYTATKNGVMR